MSRKKRLAAVILAGVLLSIMGCGLTKLGPKGWSANAHEQVTSSQGTCRRPTHNRQYQNVLTYEEIVNWRCPDFVYRAEALADLARFQQIVEQAYAGYDYFADQGHDWEATFVSLRTAVEAKKKWTPYEFAQLMAKGLRFTNDLHFSFSVVGSKRRKDIRVGSHISPYFGDLLAKRLDDGRLQIVGDPENKQPGAEWYLEKCRGEAPDGFLFRTVVPHFPTEVYLLGVLSPDPVETLPVQVRSDEGQSRQMTLPLHRGRMAGYRADYGSAFHYRSEPFPVLQLTTFDILGGSRQVKQQLERFLGSASWPEIKESPYVLVDLRGNGGGMDQAYRPWLLELTDEPIRSSFGASTVSPVVYEGIVNAQLMFHVKSGQSLATKESFEAIRQSLLEGVFERFPEEHRELLHGLYEVHKRQLFAGESQVFEPTAPSRFPGTLLVLCDGRTGSAAESFIAMSLQLERAILLGENSAGTTSFGEILPFMLPHSQILFHCGHNLSCDERGEIHEGIGYLPDYWLDVRDPLEFVLNNAERFRPRQRRQFSED